MQEDRYYDRVCSWIYVVSSEGHFGSMSSDREREREIVFSEAARTFCWRWMRAYE